VRAEPNILREKDWVGTLAFEAALRVLPKVLDAIVE